jgi:hypothetical protein
MFYCDFDNKRKVEEINNEKHISSRQVTVGELG